MTEQQFIDTIAPYIIKYAKQYGYKICSAAIAQACLESGYGTSPKAMYHNYFGLKYRPNRVHCNNGYFQDGGSEQNLDGSYTMLPSTTAWYRFDNMDRCCEGYYQFINIPNYAKVKTATSPLVYLQEIKAAGYATSLNYVEKVLKVVVKWNLTKYDNELNSNKINNNLTTENKTIDIVQFNGKCNLTNKTNRPIQWIVIHYTAGTKSTAGAAKEVAGYFNKTTTKASADFIVDDEQIVQYNSDPKNYYTWAVGGKKYSSLSTSLGAKYYQQCTNANSISIEMCSRKINITTLQASDDDWYISNLTINNTIKLTKYLMQLYNIDVNHVIMHHMVTGKWCPQPWCKNENALSEWKNFLNKIGGAETSSNVSPSPSKVETPASAFPYLVRINTNVLNVRSGPGTQYSITTTVKRGSVYTIVAEENGWGRLKSGAGYIKLSYTIKA